jgi:antitoxin MazE
MLAKIQKWGNSQGLRLTKTLLADARVEVGDEVEIIVKDGVMIVTPAQKIRGRHCLKVDWGKPVGREVW